MAGKNIISKLFGRADKRSLNPGYTTMWNNIPVQPFDNLSQAIYGGYCKSDIIYSVVNKKAKAGARAPFGVYKVKSISAYKEYKDYMSQKDITLKRAMQLKESAIEPKKHPLNDKFQNPNEDQSGSEYTESLLTYLDVTGNAFEYSIMNGKDVLQFRPLPADLIQIKADGGIIPTVVGYEMILGIVQKFKKEEIIHTKFTNPRWTIDGKQLYGMSPLQVLWNLLQGDDEGFDAIAEQRKNRGARKLVGIESDKIENYKQAKQMMDDLTEEFVERSKEFRDRAMPIWGKITTHDMGLSAKDMDMLNSSQLTFERVCNALSVPIEWFSSNVQSKYNNLEQFNKQALINGVLPNMNKLRDARIRWANKNQLIGIGETIDYDVSVYSELDINKGEMMQWLKDAPFSEDEKRVFLGEQATGADGMDEVLVPRNKVGISQINKINEKSNTQADQGTGGESQEGAGKARAGS